MEADVCVQGSQLAQTSDQGVVFGWGKVIRRRWTQFIGGIVTPVWRLRAHAGIAKIRSVLLLIITVVLAVVGVGVGAANASTTSSQDCVMVVGKGATPDAVSPVLYQYCSTASMAAARQHLMSSQVRDQL